MFEGSQGTMSDSNQTEEAFEDPQGYEPDSEDAVDDLPGAPANDEPAVEYDAQALRHAILTACTEPITIEDLQHEIVEGRRRAGVTPEHVPEGIVGVHADALVTEGLLTFGEGGPTYHRVDAAKVAEDRDATIKRRALIIAFLLGGEEAGRDDIHGHLVDHEQDAEQLDADLQALAGVVGHRVSNSEFGTEEIDQYSLTDAAAKELDVAGARFLAERTVPLPKVLAQPVVIAPPAPDRSAFEQRVAKELDDERRAHALTQSRYSRLKEWCVKKNVAHDIISDAEQSPPVKHIYTWTRTVKMNGKERARIASEFIRLDREAAMVKVRHEGATAVKNRDLKLIIAEREILTQACQSNEWTFTHQAYDTVNWARGVTEVRDGGTNEILEEVPIPRGTQKPLPGTEAPPEAQTSPAAKSEPPPAPDAEAPTEPAPAPAKAKRQLTATTKRGEYADAIMRLAARPDGITDGNLILDVETALDGEADADARVAITKTVGLLVAGKKLKGSGEEGHRRYVLPEAAKKAKKPRARKGDEARL